MAAKRLLSELGKLERDPPPGVTAYPTEDNILEWDAVISGPEDTPFQGGVFRLKLRFPVSYPAQPPAAWFYTKMFHPNVYPDGKICLDILQRPEKWDSTYDVAAVLCSIQAMLGDPNPKDPANGDANEMFQFNRVEYEKKVREIVQLSAQEEEDFVLNQNQLDQETQLEADFNLALSLVGKDD